MSRTPSRSREPGEDARKVFITNIDGAQSQQAVQNELRQLFSRYGPVSKLNVKKNKNGLYSFAFLEFDTSQAASASIKELDQFQLFGKRMRVRQDRQSEGCFHCRRPGHFAKECPLNRDSRRSRSPRREEDRRRDRDYRGDRERDRDYRGEREREREREDRYRDSYRRERYDDRYDDRYRGGYRDERRQYEYRHHRRRSPSRQSSPRDYHRRRDYSSQSERRYGGRRYYERRDGGRRQGGRRESSYSRSSGR